MPWWRLSSSFWPISNSRLDGVAAESDQQCSGLIRCIYYIWSFDVPRSGRYLDPLYTALMCLRTCYAVSAEKAQQANIAQGHWGEPQQAGESTCVATQAASPQTVIVSHASKAKCSCRCFCTCSAGCFGRLPSHLVLRSTWSRQEDTDSSIFTRSLWSWSR